jgi:pimeloyl-ACP methyl ester carboxylesterase
MNVIPMKPLKSVLFGFAFVLLTGNVFSQSEIVSNYFTAADGVRINYEVKGEGKPVVLLHGFMNTQENWKKAVLYNDLSTAGFKVITLDLRGNGKSDKPHQPEAYANDAEAKDVMQLISLLDISKYFVVGYSRGAIIASRLLVLDKRVSKTVIGGMGSDFTNPEWPRRIMFYRALNNENIPELRDMVKGVQDRGLDQQALACQQKEQPSTSPEEFKKVKTPVLVICGDQDSANGSADDLAKLIPNSILKKVPGEHANTSRTQPFADEVIAFLKSK